MATDWELDECTSDAIRFRIRCHPPLISEVDPRMNRAILLAHYDRDGIIDPYVIAAAREYRRFADTLVLISVSTKTLPQDLSGIVDAFIPRENAGYDFGSWRAGLQALGSPTDFDEIICVNDSVYGPLFDLAPALESHRLAAVDFWGMTVSEKPQRHVQSWFFAMRSRVIRSEIFRMFWDSCASDLPKEEIISRRELGLSHTVQQSGFRLAGVYDGRDAPLSSRAERSKHCSPWAPQRTWRHLRKTWASRAPFNPSELFYARLWQSGVPYIKRRIFTENYYGLDLPQVQAELETLSPDWAMLIRSHRQRMGRH
jgi:lipopolysaccharide biosynthesis protein